ncbi:MAG: type I CRISPR-associated protein Cas7 [Thermoguttaceae bacterium]|nr:type I CRISPR-associated protein Cas7 [Thermoguttaceae bacterium]
MSKSAEFLNRAVGLMVIEVVNSNPNGDPDMESDPRWRTDERGEISPVSFKRKVRDLIEDKTGPVWQKVGAELNPENFKILESPSRDRKTITNMAEKAFIAAYWDARVFGSTFLEKKSQGGSAIKSGVVQFALGVSVAPIEIIRMTNTNKSGVQEGKDKGMAPLGYRVVQHGVYCMPFFVNPTAAVKSGCTQQDIDLLCDVIPYAYAHTASYARADVRIRHAWYIEHKDALGSCSDFALIDALRPKCKDSNNVPTTRWEDYDVPVELPKELAERVLQLRDLAK